jgi:predicted 2-oxoglutarate/Fe(II)-dependent dioxygenase YbiX
MRVRYAVGGPFLPPPLCDLFVKEVERDDRWRPSEVSYGSRPLVDTTFRSSQWSGVPYSCDALVAGRMLAVTRSLVCHFGRIRGVEGPNVLRYRAGDFFRTHQDENPANRRAEGRRVTVVAFLNDSEFLGGTLRLDDLGKSSFPLLVSPRKGRFVAFPANVRHDVSPVEGGARYTLVWWCY